MPKTKAVSLYCYGEADSVLCKEAGPVSYTHLYVYKRQGQNCPDFQLQSCVFCLYCLVISRFFILFYIFIPASAFSSNFFIWKKLGPPRGRSEPVRLDIRSVSYTHLSEAPPRYPAGHPSTPGTACAPVPPSAGGPSGQEGGPPGCRAAG